MTARIDPAAALQPLDLEAESSLPRTLTVDVPGEAIPQGSMQAFVRGGRAHLTSDNPRLKDWRRRVTTAVEARMRLTGATVLDEPVAVRIDFWLPRPPSIPKRRHWPAVRPDVDKLARACLDALTGTAIVDDSRVVDLRAVKHYAHGACGVRITIEPIR